MRDEFDDLEPPPPTEPTRYASIHRAVLAGLLGNLGVREEGNEYAGARGRKFSIFPGSGLYKRRPPWVMAGELVETTKLYARTVARIDPAWIEQVAEHLVQRTYSEPRWVAEHAHVRADEKVALFGLTIVPKRPVHYGPINPEVSRRIFIEHALVAGEYRTNARYAQHNRRLVEEVLELEAKSRERGLLASEAIRFAFFDARVPATVFNGPTFERWRREAERRDEHLLFMRREDLIVRDIEYVTAEAFPKALTIAGASFPLEYRLDPGDPSDGVTVTVPLAALNQLPPERFDWLVPGLLRPKIDVLIRSLPKHLRTEFIPVADFAHQAAARLRPAGDGDSLYAALATFLGKASGVTVRPEDLRPDEVPDHLRMNIRVQDAKGLDVATGRDLAALRKKLGIEARNSFASGAHAQFHRDNITAWDFGDLPERVEVRRHGLTLQGFPALLDNNGAVSLRLFDTLDAARAAHRGGLKRLFMLQLGPQLRHMERTLPRIDRMCMHYAPLGAARELKADLVLAITDRGLLDESAEVRTLAAFQDRAGTAWQRMSQIANEASAVADQVLEAYHDLALKLGREAPPVWAVNMADMREQLANLVPRHFVLTTPPSWLAHVPRYLKAMQMRHHKLTNAGLNRDNQGFMQVAPLWEQFKERAGRHRAAGVVDQRLWHYRWMLEELRVSLFAQELKTAVPVSAKKLEALWDTVRP